MFPKTVKQSTNSSSQSIPVLNINDIPTINTQTNFNPKSQRQNVTDLLSQLQQQKQKYRKYVEKQNIREHKIKHKEVNQKERSFRDNQFVRHPGIFKPRSTENMHFQKPKYVRPEGYEKVDWRQKIQQRQTLEQTMYKPKNTNQSTLFNTSMSHSMNRLQNSLYIPYTTKSGHLFDANNTVYKSLDNIDLNLNQSQQNKILNTINNSKQNFTNQQSVASISPQNKQLPQPIHNNSIQQQLNNNNNNNYITTQTSTNQLISLQQQLNNSKMQNSCFTDTSRQKIQNRKQNWREHYGRHQHQPLFNSLNIDMTLTNKKWQKKQKTISNKAFLPSDSGPKKRVFSQYPYKLPEIQDHNQKINKLINTDFNIPMGF